MTLDQRVGDVPGLLLEGNYRQYLSRDPQALSADEHEAQPQRDATDGHRRGQYFE
jgi:hypothetical protein